MTEARVFVDQDLQEGGFVELPAAAHRHLAVVLRKGSGDTVVLFNGRGGQFRAVLENIGKRTIRARIGAFSAEECESPLRVTLAQGVSKGERMDYAIQKAVELGVSEIHPLLTERCVVRLSEERWQRKQEHWQGIAVAASEQSGRTRVPHVKPVADLRDWLNGCPPRALKLVLAPVADTSVARRQDAPSSVVLLVGPEGGLSELELRLADLAGFAPMSLGPRVLRTETAGVVALSVLQALWGDLGTLRSS